MRALAVVLALLPAVASAQIVEMTEGERSVVGARYQWGSTGGDWAVPAGAPAPAVDCRGDFRSGACGATQFTPSGSPGLASTYWRPGGGAVAGAGVAFDGVDDKLTSTAPTMAGSFTICARFSVSSLTGDPVIASEWGASAPEQGWYFQVASVGNAVLGTAGFSASTAASAVQVGAASVVCASYSDAATNAILVNANGVTASQTSATEITASTASLVVGAAGSANRLKGSASRVTLWQGWAATASDLARMVRSQYAAQGSLGEPLTVTRVSSKSCSIGGAWFTVPANQPCIGDAGLSVEGQSTNYATYSEAINSWGGTGREITPDLAVSPTGAQTMDRVVSSTTTGLAIQSDTFGTASTTATHSIWARSISGTAYETVGVSCTIGGLSTCACSRSDAGACTATKLNAYDCSAVASIGETPVRIAVTATCSSGTGWGAWVHDGRYNTDSGVGGYFWGSQLEAGASASSYIATTTTPVTRQADVLSFPIPAGARWAVYTLGGTRYTLDVSALSSPLTVGPGQALNVTGDLTGLHFCRSPFVEDCQ